MFALIAAALAEPPMFTSVEVAVPQAELVVVGEPVRVEFEALSDGESLKGWSLKPFWLEYRVDQVLFGSLRPNQIIRVHTEASGCEPYDFTVRREGGTFIERVDHGGAERTLDPSSWLRQGQPTVLILDQRDDGSWWNVGHGATPHAATDAHLEQVAAAVSKRAQRKKR